MSHNTLNVSSFSIAFFVKGQSVTADEFRAAYDSTVGAYTTPTQLFSEELIRQLQKNAPEGFTFTLPEADKAFITEDLTKKTLSGSYFGEVDMSAEETIKVLTDGIRKANFPHGFVMLSLESGVGRNSTQHFIMNKTADVFTQVNEEEWANAAEVNGTFI